MDSKTRTSKFLDTIDNIDRYFYGRKMKNFIIGSVFVIIIAPVLDELLEVPHDRLTHLTTFVFFFYTLILFLAWISAWRDDNGKVTWACIKSRLLTYWEVFRDTAEQTKTNSKDENLYKIGWFLFFGGLCWKAFQNLSIFIRKPAEWIFNLHWMKLRHFEALTRHWFWLPMILGVGIMFYLFKINKEILQRIKTDLLFLFSTKKSHAGYNNDLVKIDSGKLIVSNKSDNHIQEVLTTDNSSLFNRFVQAMKTYNPGTYHYEYEYQNMLYKHLKKTMRGSVIELEYPIEDAYHRKGRADIVIDDTILIEMKKDSSAGAVQRAQGQISTYSDIWRNRGPVVLLLCNYELEHAKLSFSSTMVDLSKLERPVLTIVAEN